MFVPEDYIRRTSSTIPFGYVLDDNFEGYLKPIPEELTLLKEVAESVFHGEISLGIHHCRLCVVPKTLSPWIPKGSPLIRPTRSPNMISQKKWSLFNLGLVAIFFL